MKMECMLFQHACCTLTHSSDLIKWESCLITRLSVTILTLWCRTTYIYIYIYMSCSKPFK